MVTVEPVVIVAVGVAATCISSRIAPVRMAVTQAVWEQYDVEKHADHECFQCQRARFWYPPRDDGPTEITDGGHQGHAQPGDPNASHAVS